MMAERNCSILIMWHICMDTTISVPGLMEFRFQYCNEWVILQYLLFIVLLERNKHMCVLSRINGGYLPTTKLISFSLLREFFILVGNNWEKVRHSSYSPKSNLERDAPFKFELTLYPFFSWKANSSPERKRARASYKLDAEEGRFMRCSNADSDDLDQLP